LPGSGGRRRRRRRRDGYVYDLETLIEKCVSLGRKMVLDAVL
jgi:hypothetical protein